MKLWFLPFVREGIAPARAAGVRAQVSVSMRLESPGRTARDIMRVLDLAGPGDVIAIEPRQVLRATPAPGSRDAEPDFFPSVEFDAPDLPWAYSPTLADGTRLLPWIALVVIEVQPGVSVDNGEQGQSPWILRLTPEAARAELPDINDAWTWAHAQVACETADQIASTLASHPDRTLGRLLAPRRLLPNRAYHACVVPTFLSGRVAGLGGDPASAPSIVTGREPAWSATDLPRELPAYHTWSFRTGAAGDFESLAQRLRPTPLDASSPPTPLNLALPDNGTPLVVDWEAPLRVPDSGPTRERRPPAAVTGITEALQGGVNPPVLGPSYFGSSWTDERPLAPADAWAPELNLTPMWRAAAGLGAETVRGEQESLVAAASDQIEAHRKAQREGRRKQLAATVMNRVKMRLAAAPAKERSRVFAPLLARQQPAAADVGMFTLAGRRLARKTLRVTSVRPTDTIAGGIIDGTTVVTTTLDDGSGFIPAIVYRPAIVRTPVVAGDLPVAPADPGAIDTGLFAPRFSRPMSEPLAERFPELMLPGLDAVPSDGVLLVESNPAFVEAFLVGGNQELNYELLWRGLPSDRRATAFRRFWGHAGGSDDIGAISEWTPSSGFGSHVNTFAALVMLVRGELVRRYPSVMMAAVPASWNPDGSRSPVNDPGSLVLPTFRGRIGADIFYAGFARPSLDESVGTPSPTGPPGWFFLLSENPGDPRFGLDPAGATAPPTRASLSWSHLTLAPNAEYAALASFPDVPDVSFTAGAATAATMANLVRQRPFRAFLHASLLVRPRP